MRETRLKQALEFCLTPSRTVRRFLLEHGMIKEGIVPQRTERPLRDLLIDRVVTLRSAMVANNPGGVRGLLRSLEIEDAKKRCIDEVLCEPQLSDRVPEDLSIPRQCEFTLWDIQRECSDIDKALADCKTVKRHLQAEVGRGDLDNRIEAGRTVYIRKLPGF